MGISKGVVLLDDCQSSNSQSNYNCFKTSTNEMLGNDPAASCGSLLFAVYYNCKGSNSIFSPPTDGFISPCDFHGPLENDVISLSGNFGLEFCWLEHAWAAAVESVKTTGLVLLLGVGGLICYKLYTNNKETILQGLRTIFTHSEPLLLDSEEELLDDDFFDNDITTGLNYLACGFRNKSKLERKGTYCAQQIKTRWRHVTLAHKATQTSPDCIDLNLEFQGKPLRRNYSTPEGLVLQQRDRDLNSAEEQSNLYKLGETDEMDYSNFLDGSPQDRMESYRIRSYSLSVKDDRSQAEAAPWSRYQLWKEGSIDSFVSGADVSEVSRLIRECSIDSEGSEFSLNMSFHEACGLTTLRVMERIEAEVNQVKSNCLEMNRDLFTLHDDPESEPQLRHAGSEFSLASGMSGNLTNTGIPPDFYSRRASFRGLLNLTSIPDEVGDSVSVTSDSPFHRLRHFSQRMRTTSLSSNYCISEDDPTSLEWDNEGLFTSSSVDEVPFTLESVNEEMIQRMEITISGSAGLSKDMSPITPSSTAAGVGGSFLEIQGQHLWNSQESGYIEWDDRSVVNESSSILPLSPLPEKREKDYESMSCCTAGSLLTTPEDEVMSVDDASECKRRQWAESRQRNRDSAVYDVGIDVEASWAQEAVGSIIDISSYTEMTWQAQTPRAYAIKEAYAEVVRLTGCRFIRRMRGDNYGILRAALFQMFLKKLPLPKAQEAVECISKDLQRGNSWIKQWSFGNRLPYGSDNVFQGICECLFALDQLVADLSQENDPAETLTCRLNSDVNLDTQVMEALKLHLLSAALSLELAETLGDALPQFALALFSRSGSRTTREMAMNYIDPVGDSVILDQAEFYLLGLTLGVRLDVYRPTAVSFDKEENISLCTSYPNWDSFTNFISIIEEDDRHYSVPVP